MNVFRDKIAVVKGAASGIGGLLAVELARRGAKLVLVYRGGAEVRADIANKEKIRAFLDRALALHGRIDCLFDNALSLFS